MTTATSVSVVIPVYNGERYVAQAIESVLGQSVPPAEVLVVDDGSDDGTPTVVRAFEPRVEYHRQGNSGAAAARNTGIEKTTGAIVAFLDADDLWRPQKLELQLNALRECPELDMVFCRVDEFVSPDSSHAITGGVQPRTSFAGYLPSGALVRRRAFDRVGLFATDAGVGEFIDWYARATDAGLKGLVLPETLLERRIHDTNQGVTKRDSYNAEYLRILKKALDRRRARHAGKPDQRHS